MPFLIKRNCYLESRRENKNRLDVRIKSSIKDLKLIQLDMGNCSVFFINSCYKKKVYNYFKHADFSSRVYVGEVSTL